MDWVDCQDPSPTGDGAENGYGIDPGVQEKIASIRTDLDSFTEVEAYALMLSGYRMTEHQIRALQAKHKADEEHGTWGGFDVDAPRKGDWRFLALEPIVAPGNHSGDQQRADLELQLEVGQARFFKLWRLDPVLRAVAVAGGVAAAAALAWLVFANWGRTVSFTVGGVILIGLIAGAAMLVPVMRWLDPNRAAREYLFKAVLAVVGYLVASIHLGIFDRRFKARGRLRRLLGLAADGGKS